MYRFVFGLLLITTSVFAEEHFEFRAAHCVISYRIPPALGRSATNVFRGTQSSPDDKRIFVAGYTKHGLFRETTTGVINLSLLDWPAGAHDWVDAQKAFQDHLAKSELTVSVSQKLYHGITWAVFEKRETGTGILRGGSCYAPLSKEEILYFGLLLYPEAKTPKARQQEFLAGVDEALSSIQVK